MKKSFYILAVLAFILGSTVSVRAQNTDPDTGDPSGGTVATPTNTNPSVVTTPSNTNPSVTQTPSNTNPSTVQTPSNTNPSVIETGENNFYLQNPLDNSKFNSVGGIVNGFIDIFTYLVILFAVLMIIYVGLRFVLAQGNTEELKTRKNQLLWLMVGVAIVIGARIMVSVVLNTLQATGLVQPDVINSAKNAFSGQ